MNDINLTYPSGLYDTQNIMKTEKQNQNWKHKTLASAFCKKLNLNGERFLTLKRHIKCIDDSQKSQNKFEDTLNTNKNSNFDLNKDVEKLLSEPSKENYIPMAPIISSEHCYNKLKTEIEMLPILNDTNGMDYEMKVFNKNLHENSNFNKNETEFNKKLKFENIEHNIQNKSEGIINSPTETIIKYQKPENIGYVKPNTTNNVNMFLNRQLESLNQSSGMFPSGYVRFTNEKLLQNGYVHPNWKNFMQTMDLYKTIHRETSNYVHSNQFYDPLLNETNIIVPCPIYNLNQNASGYVYPIKRDFLQIPNKNLSFDQNPSAYIKSFGREFQQAQKHFLEIKNSNLFVDQCSETQKLNLLLDQNISDKQTSEYVLAENLCPYETITHLSEPNINQRMNKLIDSKQDKTKDTSTYLKPIKLKELELNNEKLLINSDEYKLGGSINCESPSNIFSGYVKANVQIV